MMLGATEKVGRFAEVDTSCDWSQFHEETVNVQHKMILLMFLKSKDDNLLLLTGGLLYTILNNADCLDVDTKKLAPELFHPTEQ